jgi:hypothetical protein
MNILQFIGWAKENGGGSYNFITGEINPTTGYMVALKDFQQVSAVLDENLVKMYTREHAEFLIRDDVYLGLWLSNGLWYYDVSINVEGLANAVLMGVKNRQQAIWDCANNREIQL